MARPRYFAALDLVEVQETFYNLPRPSTVTRWRVQAPAHFEFALKAPQLITHEPTSPTYRRLRRPLSPRERARYGAFKPTAEVAAAWDETLTLARVLGTRVVLFQCPASFDPSPQHVRHLTRFFERAARDGLRFAWEPRGAWADDRIRELCRCLDLIHCVDPFQRMPVWGEPAYFRLHGRGGYRYAYTREDLHELRVRVSAVGAAYVLFNNLHMFEDARRFRELLEAR